MDVGAEQTSKGRVEAVEARCESVSELTHKQRKRREYRHFFPIGEDWERLRVVAAMNGMSRSFVVAMLVHELCENPRVLRLK